MISFILFIDLMKKNILIFFLVLHPEDFNNYLAKFEKRKVQFLYLYL